MNALPMAGSTLARLTKFEARLNSSEKPGFAAKVNQLGINMVDLMMWLVIAALLLAAALQGIGFYQKASWNYQLDSDAAAVRTYMEAQYTLVQPNAYPVIAKTSTVTDLKLTTSNGSPNTVLTTADGKGGWTATVCSGALIKAAGAANAATTVAGVTINSANTASQVDVFASAC